MTDKTIVPIEKQTTFVQLIELLRGGDTAHYLNELLADVVARVKQHGTDGKLSLTLTIERDGQNISVSDKWVAKTNSEIGKSEKDSTTFHNAGYGQLTPVNSNKSADV